MSRGFTFGILGILVVLLGVMSYIVSPKKTPEPAPEDTAKAAKQTKEVQEKQSEEFRKRMKDMMKQRTEMAKKRQNVAKQAEKLKSATPPGKRQKPAYGMDISGNWFKERPAGNAGIQQLEKEEEAAKKNPPPATPNRSAPSPPPGAMAR
jgi:hypothetical protein